MEQKEIDRGGYVFVYGTLKHNQRNFQIIEEFVLFYEPVIVHHATMYDLGSFPGVKFNSEKYNYVEGELLFVKDIDEVLKRLDRLEGYRENNPEGSFYIRRTILVESFFKGLIPAYTYEINRASLDGCPVIFHWPWKNKVFISFQPPNIGYPHVPLEIEYNPYNYYYTNLASILRFFRNRNYTVKVRYL